MQTTLKENLPQLSSDGSKMTLSGEVLNLIPADDRHRAFIISTWTKSYQSELRKLGFWEFRDRETVVAEKLWNRARVLTDDEGFVVYGYVVPALGGLEYVYVVPDLRKMGVGQTLSQVPGYHPVGYNNRPVSASQPSWLKARIFNPYNFGDVHGK